MSEPLHVAVSGAFLTQPLTGAQRYAGELLRAMAARANGRMRFTLVTPTGRRRRLEREPPPGVDLVRDETSWPLAIWTQRRLPVLVRRLGADLLWSSANTGPLRVERQVATVLDASVFACPEAFSLPFRAYYRWLLPRLGRAARRIVTISEFSRQELVRCGVADASRIDVVPPGIGPAFRVTATASSWDELKPYVLAVGSLEPRKELDVLLRAWVELARRLRPPRRLVIAGGKGTIFRQDWLSDVGGTDVRWLGRVPDEDLPQLYAGADCLVYPSRYEGFGLPPLEAMAAGTPAIVADAASLPEACGEAALYFERGNFPELARTIETVLGDEALRGRLRALGLERSARWSWEGSAARMLEVLIGAAGGSRGPGDPLHWAPL